MNQERKYYVYEMNGVTLQIISVIFLIIMLFRVCQEKCVSNQNIIYKIIKELNYNIYGTCLGI